MKVQLCSITNKDCDKYIKLAQKIGYCVYVDDTNQYCIDVLTDPPYYRMEDIINGDKVLNYEVVNNNLVLISN